MYKNNYLKFFKILILVLYDENREDIYNKYRGLLYICFDSII